MRRKTSEINEKVKKQQANALKMKEDAAAERLQMINKTKLLDRLLKDLGKKEDGDEGGLDDEAKEQMESRKRVRAEFQRVSDDVKISESEEDSSYENVPKSQSMSSKGKKRPFTCQADKEKGPDDDKNDKKDDTDKDDPMGELPIPMSEL